VFRRRYGRSVAVVALGVGLLIPLGLASAQGQLVAGALGGLTTLGIDDTPDPVIAAAGDIACDPAHPKFNGGNGVTAKCAQKRISDRLVADAAVDQVLGLGDYQYACGDPDDYSMSYDPTWGRVNPLIQAVAGNHEYQTGPDPYGGTCPAGNTTAQPYFNYFGAAAHPESSGHYSFNVGDWHLVALNGNCSKSGVGGCSATSAQTQWLKADLAANLQPCTLAFWHQPRFTGTTLPVNAYNAWWQVLYDAKADVVLNGHIHNYQRYDPLTPAGVLDPDNGITQYVVGTGGETLQAVRTTVVPAPAATHKAFGYMRMALHPTSWDTEFVNAAGTVLDTSSGSCH